MWTGPNRLAVERFAKVCCRGQHYLALRVSVPLTRHILRFNIPLPTSTESDLRNSDKGQLHADILAMREQGMSYRQIAREVGVHWTRIQQIIRLSCSC
jgi:hypothetical protein